LDVVVCYSLDVVYNFRALLICKRKLLILNRDHRQLKIVHNLVLHFLVLKRFLEGSINFKLYKVYDDCY
jgi:hypothetical protein